MKKFIYLASALLALSSASCDDQKTAVRAGGDSDQVTIKNEFGKNLVGRVTVDGTPREGVVVSDGVNVVATDAKGEYQMYTTGRQHVFISVPADCEVPTALDGSPAFYKEIAFGDKSIVQRDFNLKSCAKKTDWTLFVFADPQLGNATDADDLANTVMPGILGYTSTAAQNVYGITLGDVVWNAPSQYTNYKTQVARCGFPVFSLIGNHDHNEGTKGDVLSDKEFRDALGPTYYSVNIGDCHIITLDDIIYSGASGRNDYSQAITQAQLDWLKQDLSFVPTDKTLIIGVHAPTKRRNSGTHVVNNQALYDIVKDYADVQILSGHTHNNFTTDIAPNITETTFGAVMGAFWYPLCNDGSPRGYGELKFSGNKLVNKRYLGSETPADHQMKVYKPADAAMWQPSVSAPNPAYDKILINIFFWHTDWTVEVQEDGGAWTTLDPATDRAPKPAWDPDVHKQVDPSTGYLPAGHNTAAPENNNDHMFLYKPAEGWNTVNVRATDSFGNVYTSSVTK